MISLYARARTEIYFGLNVFGLEYFLTCAARTTTTVQDEKRAMRKKLVNNVRFIYVYYVGTIYLPSMQIMLILISLSSGTYTFIGL